MHPILETSLQSQAPAPKWDQKREIGGWRPPGWFCFKENPQDLGILLPDENQWNSMELLNSSLLGEPGSSFKVVGSLEED